MMQRDVVRSKIFKHNNSKLFYNPKKLRIIGKLNKNSHDCSSECLERSMYQTPMTSHKFARVNIKQTFYTKFFDFY